MPIGARNPQPGHGRAGAPATLGHYDSAGDPGSTGGLCDGCAGGNVQHRFVQLSSALQYVNGSNVPVATLEAPPSGSEYVLERILVGRCPIGSTTPTADLILLQAGDLDAGRIIDYVPVSAEPYASSADAEPIRLPEATPLHLVWVAGGSSDRFTATIQYRVES